MVRDLKMTLESARFKPWEMPVSHLAVSTSTCSIRQRSFVPERQGLRRLHRTFEADAALLRREHDPDAERDGGRSDAGAELLEKVVTQSNGLATQTPEQSPLFDHSRSFHRASVRRIRSVCERLD